MSWNPKYQAVQEEALVDNIVTVIQRDFKNALDTYYTIEAALPETDPRFLRDFQEHALGQILKNVFPCMAIAPVRNASTEADAADRLIEVHRIDIYVGVTDDSPATVTTRIMRYMGTLDAVLRSARKSDYFRNMSVQVFGLVLEMEHVYGPIGTETSQFFRGARMELTITVNER